jgi:outer membrane autotransporter protein
VVQTVTLNGNIKTTASSQYFVDVDFATNLTDRVTVDRTAILGGQVIVSVLNPAKALPGTYDRVILSAAGGITNHDGRTLLAPNTAVMRYSLLYPNSTDETLRYVINFAPSGLSSRQTLVGDVVNQIQTAQSSPAFAPLAETFLAIPEVSQLGALYDQASGEGVVGAQAAAFAATDAVHSAITSQTLSRIGRHAPTRQNDDGGKLWMQFTGSTETLGAQDGYAKLRDHVFGLIGGWDYRPTENSLVGAAIAGQVARFRVPDRATSGKDKTGSISLYAAFSQGPWAERIVASYGRHSINYRRQIAITGLAETSRGKFDADALALSGEVSRTVRGAVDDPPVARRLRRAQPGRCVDAGHPGDAL